MEFGFEQHVPIQLKSHLGEKGIIALLSMSKKLGAQTPFMAFTYRLELAV
jgi:hypothetical protein